MRIVFVLRSYLVEDNVSAILSPIEVIESATKDTLIVEVFYKSNSE